MRLVVLESPFKGETKEIRERNLDYALACVKDAIKRGEAPFASHLLYPLVLDDDGKEERQRELMMSFAWIKKADAVVFYQDYGISPSMAKSICRCATQGKVIEFRKIL